MECTGDKENKCFSPKFFTYPNQAQAHPNRLDKS
jgi:hypothetical protein